MTEQQASGVILSPVLKTVLSQTASCCMTEQQASGVSISPVLKTVLSQGFQDTEVSGS